MVTLRNNLGIFGEDGGSNVEDKSEGGSRDREEIENQPKKEPEKNQPSSSVVNQSQPQFKMEEKVDIKSSHDKFDILKLNHWLQQL